MTGMINILQSVFGNNIENMQRVQHMMGPFRAKYHAYAPAYWKSESRDLLEKGDKIVIPASALEQLSRLNISYPIMFRITHDSNVLPKKSHCSVLEFTAKEGNVYLPLWMIDNLGLDPSGHSVVELETVTLPKGTFVQFQAHRTKFAMLSHPRVVLENALRSYSALTIGDTVQVEFAGDFYKLDVTDVLPRHNVPGCPPAISIIETDIKVDFKEPRDYKEWEKRQKLKKTEEKTEDTVMGQEEDESDWLVNPSQATSTKSRHFDKLQKQGSDAVQLKHSKKHIRAHSMPKVQPSLMQPSRTRGAPLGKANSSQTYVAPVAQQVSPKSKKKKEEEIVGNMRYIYEVDSQGNRTCIRKLPVRKNLWHDTTAHKLN